jgi:hypothetical protein
MEEQNEKKSLSIITPDDEKFGDMFKRGKLGLGNSKEEQEARESNKENK